MKFFKLNFFKNAILTFIVFLFGFSYLGLEQKTSAWSCIPELKGKANQVVSSYNDLICQSILNNDYECTDTFFHFIESLENENQTIERMIFEDLNQVYINTYNPFYQTLFEIFYGYRDQIYQELNQQQTLIQEADSQPTQSESSSEQVRGLTLELTDSDWKTYIKKHKEEFTSNWLKENPGLDETSPEFKKVWKKKYTKEYLKIYKKTPKYKAYHKAYIKVYHQEYYQRPKVKELTKAYYQRPEVKERRKKHITKEKRWRNRSAI